MAKGKRTTKSSINKTIIVYRDCLFLAVAGFIFLFAYLDTSSVWLGMTDPTGPQTKPDHSSLHNTTYFGLAPGDLAIAISRIPESNSTKHATLCEKA
jgi:hypothetical protein